MALRIDQRTPTACSLDAYNKLLLLSDHVMSVAKPKEPKPNNKHIPKRFVNIANKMVDCIIDMGADILEANEIYVGANLEKETLKNRYADRIELEETAKRKSFRLEHIFRMLHFDVEFADSTATYMMQLITEERSLLVKWIERAMKEIN